MAPPSDHGLRTHCPFLWQLLVQDTYADGTVRALPTLVISRVSGGFQVTLQDHASNLQCSAESVVLANLWIELERVLSSGEGVFRPYKSFRVRDPLKRIKAKGS